MKILAVVKTRRTTAYRPRRWRLDCWCWSVVLWLGISVPAPPRRPKLVYRHQTVILFNTKSSIQFSTHNLTLHNTFLPLLFSKHNLTLTRYDTVDGKVSNLQHYPYVTITNKTPYDTVQGKEVHYSSVFCSDDQYSVAAQQTWTASSRGACLLTQIEAELFLVDSDYFMTCAPYTSNPGTTYGTFSILMDNENGCCVVSSHEKQQCPRDRPYDPCHPYTPRCK